MDAFYLFILLGFVAVVLLLEGLYLTWNTYKGPEAARIERRLRAMSAGAHGSLETPFLKERLLSETRLMQRILMSVPRVQHLDRLILEAGLTMKVGTLLGIAGAFAVAGLFLPLIFAMPLFIAIVCSAFAGSLPFLNLLRLRRNRLVKFEEQLADVLDLLARALRAGHALPSAIKMVADEMADPAAAEFRIVFDEVNYGFSMEDALVNLSTRVPSTDLRYFVVAVIIQRETGGNLAELLGNISALIRARLKIIGTIRVLSAEGKLSASILTLLPFILAILINLINPGFMSVLWKDDAGVKMVVGVVILMLIGIFWMRQIVRIRV